MSGRQIPSSVNMIWGSEEGEGLTYHGRLALSKVGPQFLPGEPWTDILGGLSIKSLPNGAVGDGVANDSDAIAAKDAAAAAAGKALIVSPGTYRFAQNKTLTSHIVMMKGARFTGTTTVTMPVPEAGRYQIFGADITIIFSGGGVPLSEWFGARPDGTTDSTKAIQSTVNSMPSGGEISFALGTYIISNPVYLLGTSDNMTWTLSGRGRGTVLKPNKTTAFNMLVVNQDANGNRIMDFPSAPRAIFKDFAVDGTSMYALPGNPLPSFCLSNQAAVVLNNLTFDSMNFGVDVIGSNDMSGIFNVKWRGGVGTGWLWRDRDYSGDGFVASQIFTSLIGTQQTISLNRCYGGTIENCVGGIFRFDDCQGIRFSANHLEGIGQVLINDSVVSLEDNYFDGSKTGSRYPIVLDNIAGNAVPSYHVFLKSNVFIADIGLATDEVVPALNILGMNARSDIHLIGNRGRIFAAGRLAFLDTGITARAPNDAALNTALQDNSHLLSGDAYIYRDGTNAIVEGILPDGRRFSKSFFDVHSIPNFNISAILDSGTYVGNFALSTFYYRCALRHEGLSTNVSTEVSFTMTVATRSIVLTISPPLPFTILRIWRGTVSNTYDRYVDIPIVTDSLELHDLGASMMGFPWILAGVPVVPVVNSTFHGVLLRNATVIQPRVDAAPMYTIRDAMGNPIFSVDTINRRVGVRTNTPQTSMHVESPVQGELFRKRSTGGGSHTAAIVSESIFEEATGGAYVLGVNAFTDINGSIQRHNVGEEAWFLTLTNRSTQDLFSVTRINAGGGQTIPLNLSTNNISFSGTNFTRGTGSPEGIVIGSVGDIFLRTDGSAGTTFYVKESGAGSTGWAAK